MKREKRYEDIGNRLREAIAEKSINQPKLVELLNSTKLEGEAPATIQYVGNMINGWIRPGDLWKNRLERLGIDMVYVMTGRKQSNEILDTKQQYVKEEVYTMAIPHNFGDDIEIEKTELGEKTQFTFYRLKKKDDYRETMRNAEPEFTEGQKMPMPLRIEDKPEGVLIKPFEIQGKVAAKPVQPDSRKEYEESL